jgi:hypothetical protein
MAKKAPRSWGYWTEGKLDILARYLDRFTTTTKHKAEARIYLDAFAGEGHGTSRTTKARFDGSARIGLRVGDPPRPLTAATSSSWATRPPSWNMS